MFFDSPLWYPAPPAIFQGGRSFNMVPSGPGVTGQAAPATATVDQTATASSNAAVPKMTINTAALVSAMFSTKGASDLIFSPGRPPQVELNGTLRGLKFEGLPMLTPEHTAKVAQDLIGSNVQAARSLNEEGSCDLSYSLPQQARFRVNVFKQRGSLAIVMRVIPNKIPNFAELNLPAELKNIADLKNGIVLVTGPTGSGKSSTLAAIVDLINSTRAD